MGIEDIPASGWMWALLAAVVLLNLYNTIATARRNAREEKSLHDKPTDDLAKKVGEHARMLDNDKRRLDEIEQQMSDVKRGLMANCAGTQALLEHALHDGNTDTMEEAARGINTWLRTRP